MAGRTNAILLMALYLTILDGSKRSFKLVYMPYGPLMCRGLCKDSPDAFHFMEQSLSCHRTPQNKSADNDNRTAICSFQYLEKGRLPSDSSLTLRTGLDNCSSEGGDKAKWPHWTAGYSPSRNQNTNYSITLHQACEEGDLCTVQYILSNNLTAINFRGKLGRTPVMVAALKGRVAVFDYLISRGCDLSAVDDTNVNVLHIACMSGGIDIVKKLLVNLNYDIETRGRKGMTPVMEAVSSGHVNVFRFLVSKGCNITTVDYNRNNVLHIACSAGHENMVKHILKSGAFSIDSRERYGRTSVMLAAVHGHVSVVELLVSNECNLFVVDQNRNNILHVACEGGHVNVVKYLLKQPVFGLENKEIKGRTPLMIAVYYNHIELVKYLRSKGSNLKITDNSGNNILHVACQSGHVNMVRFILTNLGFGIESAGMHGVTPVMMAGLYDQMNLVKYLVKKGCKLDATDKLGNNIFHLACQRGYIDMMKYILSQHKFLIDSKGRSGITPVMLAVYFGKMKVVKYLVGKRCNLTSVDNFKDSILHYACKRDNVRMVRYILSLDVIGIDSAGADNFTPILTAVCHNHIAVVKYLVRKRCNLNVVDQYGDNILHLACLGGNIEMVKYLLTLEDVKRKREKRNTLGQTPLKLAVEGGYTNIVRLLEVGY